MDLLGNVIYHDWRIEILKIGPVAKNCIDAIFKCWSVRKFRGLDVLPQIDTTATPRFLVKEKSFVDQVWIGLPCRNTRPEFIYDVVAAHSFWHFPKHNLCNHDGASLLRGPKARTYRSSCHVRFRSKAGATSHVRLTPNRDCKSGYLRFVMSA